jgi:acetate kinase
MNILVLNAGSSSQKSCLYDLTALSKGPLKHSLDPLWEAQIDWAEDKAQLRVKTARGEKLQTTLESGDRTQDLNQMLTTLWSGTTQVIENAQSIQAVGHRVVHGGQDYSRPVQITDEVKAAIARLSFLAPAHNPANLQGIETLESLLGAGIPQVAVFDTAFHSQLPDAAALYPVPYNWVEQGIRRYGFHGISHEYCAQRVAQLLDRDVDALRLITCHLGNGCSLAAIAQGKSIDTTMGFTPLDGLMMGTRSGSVDPGILIHLIRQQGYTADQLDQALNRESGLKGLSGISGDLRAVTAAINGGNQRAQLALDVYIHRLRSLIGSMLASLGGLDALVFTAGVGENSPLVRAAACEAFEFLGLKLDLELNESRPVDQDIATPDSAIRVFVIHTQEDWAIAKSCYQCVSAEGSGT